MAEQYKRVEYMCRNCGKRTTKIVNQGKPLPGICPRKTGGGAHMWIVNRRF
jgi:hypothetical protein